MPITTIRNHDCTACGFIDGVDLFDADFFDISPREAQKMTHNSVFSGSGLSGLENANLSRTKLSGTKTGVFVVLAIVIIHGTFLEI
jgi:acyl transferase domain-containing protein